MTEPVRVYFVLGEQSGDALGYDLLMALCSKAAAEGKDIEAHGLAGQKLQGAGITSLFDIKDIAIMGFSAVVTHLPLIVRRVYSTVADILEKDPDVVVLIDNPDFCHAVAKRVRRKRSDIPIVNYVCPSVWAWRQGRARRMTAYIDHVMALLPFEPDILRELGGPKATYVGHPLAYLADWKPDSAEQNRKPHKLLILPGSRKNETKRLLPIFGDALIILRSRGVEFEAVLPAVPFLKEEIENAVVSWPVRPKVIDSAGNFDAFASARAALAASGTVSLELALHRVPMSLSYKLDLLARPFGFLVKTWSAALPNLIADAPVIPENMNEAAMAHRLAREIEQLLDDTPSRQAQLAAFEKIADAIRTDRPAGEQAAEIVWRIANKKQ